MGEVFGGCEGGLIQHSLHGADCTKPLYIQQLQELQDEIPNLREVSDIAFSAIMINPRSLDSMQAEDDSAAYKRCQTFPYTIILQHEKKLDVMLPHPSLVRLSPIRPPQREDPATNPTICSSAQSLDELFFLAKPRRQTAPPCAYNPPYRTRLVPLHTHTPLGESLACPHFSSACAPTSRGPLSSHLAMRRDTHACKDGLL
jgi:hypothetical protein